MKVPDDYSNRLVQFVYVDQEQENDREFTAFCDFLPRVGDTVHPPDVAQGMTVVRMVTHRFAKPDQRLEGFLQQVTVVLGDESQPWPPQHNQLPISP